MWRGTISPTRFVLLRGNFDAVVGAGSSFSKMSNSASSKYSASSSAFADCSSLSWCSKPFSSSKVLASSFWLVPDTFVIASISHWYTGLHASSTLALSSDITKMCRARSSSSMSIVYGIRSSTPSTNTRTLISSIFSIIQSSNRNMRSCTMLVSWPVNR